jgi:phage terminase small subunit
MGEKRLTLKEERFCQEYVLWLNATKAAINSGYSERSARQIAARMLSKDYIQSRIQNLKGNLAETAAISALRIAKEHEKIAFMDFGQLRDGWVSLKVFEALTDEQKACIQEISSRQLKKLSDEGEMIIEEWVKIKLYDKQKSLDSLSRMFGYDAPQKIDLDIQQPVVIQKNYDRFDA